MKVLFIHEVSYLDKVVYEMHDFPELLSLRGHAVSFIDFPEHEALWPWRRRTDRRCIKGRSFPEAEIDLISLPRLFPFPLDRLFAAVRGRRSILKWLKEIRPDVIVLYSVPTNGWQTIRAAEKLGVPVLARSIDVSHAIRRTIFRPLIRWAESYVFASADHVLFNNDALKNYGIGHGAKPDRSSVLFPGFALPTRVDRPSSTDVSFNVVFMGSLFPFSGLDWFIEELAQSPEARSRIRLRIIGDGEIAEDLHCLVRDKGLGDIVTFAGRVAFDQLDGAMRGGLVGVLPFAEDPVARLALPGKVPQYLLSNLVTVSTRLEGLQSLLSEGEGVVYRPPGREFLDAVIDLLDNSDKRSVILNAGQLKIEEETNWPTQIAKFEEMLLALVSNR